MIPNRSIWSVAILTALTLGAGVAPVFGHHSFGLFDMSKSSEIEGSVIKLEWSNPHCWLFVAVASPDSGAVSYGFELTSVGEMTRRGWTKSVVKPGDKIKVMYHPVRDGRPAGYMVSVMTPDGRYIGRPPPAAPDGPAAPQAPPGLPPAVP
jgi:Family of unknown function (DUF6152)